MREFSPIGNLNDRTFVEVIGRLPTGLEGVGTPKCITTHAYRPVMRAR